ncbi:Clr5 domain-containing protein [Fusarium keratoplasticum]|uniref:Clr5 domain-containing protein n=1 Tax=Fusarium keratoplasticum TaxID=1328300 RepID=A0ACC0QBT0_9HYPO|nr:Clr5 domain-containing protein [Fusarium keratoplasticum]KAI8650323.1 Clr5 domain-containing protein [Fusarium keratoplasticum]
MSRADKIPRSEWESNKEHIRALYLDQDKSLDDLVTSMSEEHDFHATLVRAQYIRKLGNWNMKKYSSKEDWKHADTLIRKRKVEGKDTEIFMNGKLVSAKKLKKELGRYAWQQTCGQQPSVKNSLAEVIARTPPASTMEITLGYSNPLSQFHTQLHWLMTRNSIIAPDLDIARPNLSSSPSQADVIPFIKKLLLAWSGTKASSKALSLIQEEMPRMPDLDTTAQVSRRDAKAWSLALEWAVYRCTNNLLDPYQIDELLGFASASGNLAVLKAICRMPGPTTKILLSNLLPGAIRLRDLVLARFLLDLGAHPDARDGSYRKTTPLHTAVECHEEHAVQLLLAHGADPDLADYTDATPLHLSIAKPGGLAIAKMLVQAGADLDLPGCRRWGNSPLMIAVANRDMEATRFLIEAGADMDFLSERSALQIAVEARNVEIVKFLLNKGADPNIGVDINDKLESFPTPLYLRLPLKAAVCKSKVSESGRRVSIDLSHSEQQCRREIINLLLQAGADVNALPTRAGDEVTETPLQAASRLGDLEIFSLFISHGGDIHAPALEDKGMTCLQAAAHAGSIDIAYLLLLMGADVNAAPSMDGWTALQAAAATGKIELVKMMLKWGANISQCSPQTALEAAIDYNQDAVVELLLDAGADINQCGRVGSALFSAITQRRHSLLQRLIARRAHPDPPGCHVSPLVAAINQKWAYAAQLLICAGADVNKRCAYPSENSLLEGNVNWNWDITSPLMAAIETREVEFVEMLLEAGAELNNQASHCLQLAVENRSIGIIQILLRNGVNLNKFPTAFEKTPLQVAMLEEEEEIDLEIVKILIAAGADVNSVSCGDYPLQIVCNKILDTGENDQESSRYSQARDLLLEAGADPGLFNRNHNNLQHAAREGNIVEVRSFILSREDVNEPANDDRGATALQYAAMHGHLNIAMLLIENGAHINAPGAKIHGRTALQGAAENGRLDMVHLLLEHDDEPSLLKERCHNAAEFAEEEGHKVIAQILREWKSS